MALENHRGRIDAEVTGDGPGLTLIVLRWIRPTLVKKDSGEPVETRVYDVEKPNKGGEKGSVSQCQTNLQQPSVLFIKQAQHYSWSARPSPSLIDSAAKSSFLRVGLSSRRGRKAPGTPFRRIGSYT